MLTTTVTVLVLWTSILWLGFVVLRHNEPVRRPPRDEELREVLAWAEVVCMEPSRGRRGGARDRRPGRATL